MPDMEIKGEKVTLAPIKPDGRDEFYKLATESYGSKFWYDEEKKQDAQKKNSSVTGMKVILI